MEEETRVDGEEQKIPKAFLVNMKTRTAFAIDVSKTFAEACQNGLPPRTQVGALFVQTAPDELTEVMDFYTAKLEGKTVFLYMDEETRDFWFEKSGAEIVKGEFTDD